ncbi:MFS transporter [Phytomonospora endophytica]|uniref:MFS family permease n=1 Tax=Phytomonospora endophytica TaxID=714109 RepID=A0A841G0J1_9ACTN|nr:MFS transporter [Phytomonospora endophytica]MBB6039292.1 MFS family permease [Phytomonospora endophytica]GIG69766.1 MFS transporter [Phytomonospora endophytica]
MLPLLRDRRFQAFWLGQATSVVGVGVTVVALPGLLLTHRSGTDFAYVLAAQAGTGAFCTIFGGVFADRYSRSMLMAVSDVLCILGVGAYLALGANGPLWALLLSAGVIGVGTGLYQPAHRAAMPQIVPGELLERANALDSATKRIGMAAGSALGGLLIATVNPEVALVVNLGTYAVSLATLLFLRLPAVTGGGSGGGIAAVFREAGEGVRIVLRNRWATAIMVQGTIQVFFLFAPNYILTAIVAAERYPKGAYGWIMTAGFVGALAGSLISGRIKAKRPGLLAMNALVPCAALPVCLVWNVPLWAFCAIAFLAWAGISTFFVFWLSALSRAFPPEVHGRVFGIEHLLTFCLDPVAKAVIPAVALAVGMGVFGIVAAVVLLVSTYAVLLVPGAIRLSTPSDAPKPPSVPTAAH